MKNLFENLTPKTKTEFEYFGDTDNIKKEKRDIIQNDTTITTEYNENYEMVRETCSSVDGILDYDHTITNNYYENGKLKSSTENRPERNYQKITNYDEQGRFTSTEIVDTKTSEKEIFEQTEYDENIRRYNCSDFKEEAEWIDLKDNQWIEISHDDYSLGNDVMLSINNPNGSNYTLRSIDNDDVVKHNYDKNGNLTSVINYVPQSVMIQTYDEKENSTMMEHYTRKIEDDFDLKYSQKYNNEYDEQGRLVSQEMYTLDQFEEEPKPEDWYDCNYGRNLFSNLF